MRHPLSLVLLLCTAAACSQHPTAPSAAFEAPAMDVTSPLADQSPLDLRSVTGRATNALTGAAVGGVTIQIADVGSAVADASGNFTLSADVADGRYRIAASGAGVVARQTSLVLPGDVAAVSLIPSTFNLTAFDQMARQFGAPLGVTKRWMQAPALVIETALLDPQSVDAAGVPQFQAVASAEQLPEESIAELVTHLTRALPLMTGGHIPSFVSIDRATTPAGAPFEERSGTITVARYRGLNALCGGYSYFVYDTETLEAAQGRMFMKTCIDQRTAAVSLAAVVAHELGHALGYSHVTGVASVMTATVTTDVTEFDRQAANLVFKRPPGNQAPDVDPEAFTVNQPARARGFGRTVTVGPIE